MLPRVMDHFTKDMGLLEEKGITRRGIDYFVLQLLEWYSGNGRKFPWRRKAATRYQRVVSEVLLQRTRAEVVAMFYGKFFKQYPSWRSLSLASRSDLREILKPIGLWERRALVLEALSAEMARRNGRFPRERAAIDALAGVGQYVANAIELFVYGTPMPLLDVNMARVLERYFGQRKLADIRYDPYLQALAAHVVKAGDAAQVNWAILDFAALVCKQRGPRCGDCVLNGKCKYYADSKEG